MRRFDPQFTVASAPEWARLKWARLTRRRLAARALVAVGVIATVVGCGAAKDKPASQVAARVNSDEITVHQLNHALQAQRGMRADQAELQQSRILDRLVEQQLAVQKAQSLKIDRDPRVVQQIEAMRSEIVAKAYFDKIADGVAKPTPEEVTAYYTDNPALFRERRVYQLQEIAIQAQTAQIEAVRRQVASNKSIDDLLIYLRTNGINYTTNQVMRAAEQVPLTHLKPLSQLRDGQSMIITAANGAQVLALVESRLQPIDEERARPAIEQFMVNDRKRRVIADDVKALRAKANVEYVGKFAQAASAATDGGAANAVGATGAAAVSAAASASAAITSPVVTAPAVTTSTAATPAAATSTGTTGTTGATATPVPAPATAASAPLSNTIVNKGLGLK